MREKLRLDLSGVMSFCPGTMADDDLINQLLTIAGSIMEDASAVAIVDDGTMAMEARIRAVARVAEEVAAVARATAVMLAQRGM